MNEHELRGAIYARTDLKPNSKLALLGVLAVVDWQTWQGPCSAKDVAKRMGMAEPSVRRAFKDLTELNLISRVAKLRETVSGKTHHHRAVTRLNVKTIMSGVTLAHSALTPLAHSALTPLAHSALTPLAQNALTPSTECANPLAQNALTPLAHSALHNNHGYSTEEINLESTEDTQPTSPDQDAETVEAVEAVEVGDSDLPSELIGLSAEYIQLLREHAADHQCSLLEAYEYAQRINRNAEAKLAWRREREKSAMFNRPTTAYRPKPLY